MTALDITLIRVDGGTQIRTSTYFDKIEEYTQAMLGGSVFPPLTVFWDGEFYWLADGFHRLEAYRAICQAAKRKRFKVECEVIEGTQRDAIIHACGANDSHGIRRTAADKQAAVDTMLKNPLVTINQETGKPWTDRALARICKVSNHMIADRRIKVTGRTPSQRAYRHNKSGKTTVMNTSGINEGRAEAKAEEKQAEQDAGQQNSQTGETKPEAKAEDKPAAQVIQFTSKWDCLFTLLKRIDEAIAELPAPDIAAANYPLSLAHALPIARVVEVQRWWNEFTRFWAARDPEIQRHRQEIRDFIEENMHVNTR